MKRHFKTFSTLFLLGLLCLTVPAQDLRNEAKTNNLILEVTYWQGEKAAIQKIGASESRKGSAWYARFRRINGWQPKTGEFPVRAVNIVPYFDADGSVKIRVSVFTGERFHDNELFVTDVVLRENERKTIGELTGFGVEPFELAVVQSVRGVADLPSIVNKTTSLQAFVEPEISEVPVFKVRLVNTSNKAVAAVSLETVAGDRKLIQGMPQGRDGNPLIAPNETFETVMRNNLRSLPGEIPSNYSLVVGAVVFADGTYEGEPQKAASFHAYLTGRRAFLRRSVPFWKLAAESKKPVAAINDLKTALSGLAFAPTENDLAELFRVFPGLDAKEQSRLAAGVESSLQGVKKMMLDDLANFEQQTDKTEEFARKWIGETREKYQSWLARIDK